MTTFTRTIAKLNHIDNRITTLDRELGVKLEYLMSCADKLEEVVISTLERKPTVKQRRQALGIAIANIADNGTDEQKLVVYGLGEFLGKITQIERILKGYAEKRHRVIASLRIDTVNECVIKNISSRGNKCQLTMLYDGKTVTRHLQYRDNGWYGLPPVGKDVGFIRYELTV